MDMWRLRYLAILSCLAIACQSAGPNAGGRGVRSILMADEIQTLAGIQTAFEAVQRLRPEFLRYRGETSLQSPGAGRLQVYLNGTPIGGVDALHQIPVGEVRAIRFLNGRDATTRYGTNHGGGVIEVTLGS